MAREHAQVKLAIWSDDDFRSLSPAAQHGYFVLLTSPSLSYCGVADWRPRRIAALAAGWSAGAVQTAASELARTLFILVDEDTEEVLLRSFVRTDGVMQRERMATAMAKAWAGTASAVLRGVVVHELKRLREESPELGGWGSKAAVDLLGKPSVDPSAMPLADLPVMALPIDQGEQSVDLSPTPTPTPSPHSSSLSVGLRPTGEAPSEITAQTVTAAWVDAVREASGAEPSKAQCGQVARLAKELLGKNDPTRVLDAARRAGTGGFTGIDRELTVSAARAARGPLNGTSPVRRDPGTGRAVER